MGGRYVFTIKDAHASECEPTSMGWLWGPGTLDAANLGKVSRFPPHHFQSERCLAHLCGLPCRNQDKTARRVRSLLCGYQSASAALCRSLYLRRCP